MYTSSLTGFWLSPEGAFNPAEGMKVLRPDSRGRLLPTMQAPKVAKLNVKDRTATRYTGTTVSASNQPPFDVSMADRSVSCA
jgi:hypothetical protein